MRRDTSQEMLEVVALSPQRSRGSAAVCILIESLVGVCKLA